MSKADLQAEAESLGLSFTKKTTVAQLEALIAEAQDDATDSVTGGFEPPVHPGPNERFEQGLCPICFKPADHAHPGTARDRGV